MGNGDRRIIGWLAYEVRVIRMLREVRRQDMSRLKEKLAMAAAIAPRQAAKIEARADRLIAREAEIEARTDATFGAHEALLDDAQSSMDDLLKQLAGFTNNPLDRSDDLPEEPAASH